MRTERLALRSFENGVLLESYSYCVLADGEVTPPAFVTVECLSHDSPRIPCPFSRGSVEVEEALNHKCIVCFAISPNTTPAYVGLLSRRNVCTSKPPSSSFSLILIIQNRCARPKSIVNAYREASRADQPLHRRCSVVSHRVYPSLLSSLLFSCLLFSID